jgi:hypothetical protein
LSSFFGHARYQYFGGSHQYAPSINSSANFINRASAVVMFFIDTVFELKMVNAWFFFLRQEISCNTFNIRYVCGSLSIRMHFMRISNGMVCPQTFPHNCAFPVVSAETNWNCKKADSIDEQAPEESVSMWVLTVQPKVGKVYWIDSQGPFCIKVLVDFVTRWLRY